MALNLEANYSKKIGLPQYSSHQFSVTIRTELSDIKQVELETSRLYSLLQACVDREIQQVGFLPDSNPSSPTINNGGNRNNGNGHTGNSEVWACTQKQKELIIKLVQDNHLDKHDVESLAQDRFNTSVKALNKMQASNFIEELLSKYGKQDSGNRRYNRGVRA